MPPVTTRRAYLRAVGATGVAALAGIGTTSAAETPTITLGGSMSLTGTDAPLGTLYRDAYELTVRRINDGGGVAAGDGRTYDLELRLRDDGSDVGTSLSIYQDLVDRESVDYLLGPYSSAHTLAASAVAASRGRPMVEGSGASPEIFGAWNQWTFGLLPTADTYALSTIEMAMAQADPPRSAALLTEDDIFSRSSAGGARRKLEDAGVQLVLDELFPSETSDLSPFVQRVGASGAEMLVLSAHETHAVLLASALASQSVSPKLVMATVGSLTPSFEVQAGANADYVCGPSPWNDTADDADPIYGSTQSFVAAVQGTYGYRPDYHSAAGAAAVETFAHAFEQTPVIAPGNVRDAIRGASFSSAYGDVAFDARGVIDREMVVYQWQPRNGGGADAVVVWPESVRQAPPVYPMPTWSERLQPSSVA